MVVLLFLFAVVIVALIGTAIAVRRDGYAPIRTEWSRVPERADSGAANRKAGARHPRVHFARSWNSHR